jgi:type II secretory pathway pseudopilin PulG
MNIVQRVCRPVRSAFTMLEVIIAFGILVMVLAAVFDTLVASKHLESNAASNDEVAAASGNIISAISNDLAVSGWHLPATEDLNGNDTIENNEKIINADTVIDNIVYLDSTPAEDRGLWYFPYVVLQDYDGIATSALGARFPHLVRSPALRGPSALPAGLPGNATDATTAFAGDTDAWRDSYYARSQEIVFLRSTVGQWRASDVTDGWQRDDRPAAYAATVMSSRSETGLNFSSNGTVQLTRADWLQANNHAALGVLHASGWAEKLDSSGVAIGYEPRDAGTSSPAPFYGVVLDGGWYDPDAEGTDGDMPVKIQWQTMAEPSFSRADYGPERLQEFTYAVVPTPLGLGRLVRAAKVLASGLPASAKEGIEIGDILAGDATYKMVIDRVYSDDVVRIVFDTYRTIDQGSAEDEVRTLAPNQVRLRLYMARRQISNPAVINSRMYEAILGMRSRSASAEVEAVTTALGIQPVGITR